MQHIVNKDCLIKPARVGSCTVNRGLCRTSGVTYTQGRLTTGITTPANLLSVPMNIFEDFIFYHLEYNDILRVRSLSITLKSYADHYLEYKRISSSERIINDAKFTLDSFINASIPTSKLFIENSDSTFYRHPSMKTFLRRFGKHVKDVKVNNFEAFFLAGEFNFFRELPGLKKLTILFTDLRPICSLRLRKKPPKQRFPSNFRNLECLKFGTVIGMDEMDHGFVIEMIKFCNSLHHISLPLYVGIPAEESRRCSFTTIASYIDIFNQDTLRSISLQMDDYYYSDVDLIPFLELCSRKNITLYNFPVYLGIDSYFALDPSTVTTMINIAGFCLDENFSNLKALHIKSVFASHIGHILDNERVDNNDFIEPRGDAIQNDAIHAGENIMDIEEINVNVARHNGHNIRQQLDVERLIFPNLEILHLVIDANEMTGDGARHPVNVANLYSLLFNPAQKRECLRTLRIVFVPEFVNLLDECSLPSPVNIVKSSPLITRLFLGEWQGKSLDFCTFWEGLPLLNDVTLRRCESAGLDSFVGSSFKPVFLQLTRLTKFSLLECHKMPLITDAVFYAVFRHLKIKQFYITSFEPLQNVSGNGILHLCTGEFATTIERFPFNKDKWSMQGVDDELFAQFGKMFRSSF